MASVTEETVKFTDDGGLSTAGDGLDSTVSESESPGPRQRTTVSDGDDALIVTNASPEHTLPTTHTSVYDHGMFQCSISLFISIFFIIYLFIFIICLYNSNYPFYNTIKI